MKELLYIEVPTPDTEAVKNWLHTEYRPVQGDWVPTTAGGRVRFGNQPDAPELSVLIWSVQRSTYLKVFRWAEQPVPGEKQVLGALTSAIRAQFPERYPAPPQINLTQQTIFEALAAHYPQTVKFFQRMPNGEYDLTRVYWWEQRWREGVRNPETPREVVKREQGIGNRKQEPQYDLIYVGGALGIVHAAVMARLGYRVLLMERMEYFSERVPELDRFGIVYPS
jgi:lycopene cyclase CruA